MNDGDDFEDLLATMAGEGGRIVFRSGDRAVVEYRNTSGLLAWIVTVIVGLGLLWGALVAMAFGTGTSAVTAVLLLAAAIALVWYTARPRLRRYEVRRTSDGELEQEQVS